MRCRQVKHFYDEFSRGCLPLETLARVEDHLSRCEACRRHFDDNDRLAGALRSRLDIAYPGGDYFETLLARVRDGLTDPHAIRPEPPDFVRAGRRWSQPLWWSGAAAAAVLAMLALAGEPAGNRASTLAAARTQDPRLIGYQQAMASDSAPRIVLAADGTRRELLIDPGLASLAESSAGGGLLPAGSGFDKSPSNNNDAFRERVATSIDFDGVVDRSRLLDGFPDRQPPAPQIQPVRMQALPAVPQGSKDLAEHSIVNERLDGEIDDRLAVARDRMTAEGDGALNDSLGALEKWIDSRAAGDPDVASLSAARGVRLFVEAQQALAAGRQQEAWTLYRRVVMVDPDGALAVRANLQLADFSYDEWADFGEARRDYAQCQGPLAARILTQTERQHVARQIERLDNHAANNWEALNLLHVIQHDDWPKVSCALHRLITMDQASDLLPEAARSTVQRMKPGDSDSPSADIVIKIYKEIQARAGAEPHGLMRGWLELSLGDLQMTRFQEMQAAINHYNQAIEDAGDSALARLARAKRDQLVDRQLLELVR